MGIEAGLLEAKEEIRIDTPAGRVTAFARLEGARVRSVTFRNVASFLLAGDRVFEVDGLGPVAVDLAYGGAFYAYVDAEPLGLALEPGNFLRIVDVGMRIKRAVMEGYELVHPDGDADLNYLYGTILIQRGGAHHSKNVCVFADGQVDRSPTGTGVSGRAAVHHAKGELAVGESITIASLIDTTFDVRAVEETSVGGTPAIVPEVTGSAHVTGRHEFLLDPEDPLRDGVLLR